MIRSILRFANRIDKPPFNDAKLKREIFAGANAVPFENIVFVEQCKTHFDEVIITYGSMQADYAAVCGCRNSRGIVVFDVVGMIGRIDEPKYERCLCGNYYSRRGLKLHMKTCGDSRRFLAGRGTARNQLPPMHASALSLDVVVRGVDHDAGEKSPASY